MRRALVALVVLGGCVERDGRPGVLLPTWEEVKDALGWAANWFRYIPDFINTVAGESWIGAAVVFSIFFAVFLIRSGARSGVGNIGTFAGALEHYASWGLLLSGGYLALLALVWLVMPVWSVIYFAALNGITGGEPGPLQLVAFLAEWSEQSKAFVRDVLAVYGKRETFLPLGFKSVGMIVVAFGTMWLVARGMGRLRV